MIKKISLFFCFFITINLQGQIPTDSLVAHYPFDGNGEDITSNENDGNLNSGMNSAVDRFGIINHALFFNGQQGGFVTVPNDSIFDFSVDLTISVWIRIVASANINFTALVNKWETIPPNQGGGGKGYYLGINHDDGFKIRWNTGSVNIDSNTSPTFNEWTHVLVTNSATTMKIYINGELDKSGPALNPMLPTDVDLRIGQQSEIFVTSNYFFGDMDEVLIYNRALTDDEVLQIYERDPTSISNRWEDSEIEIVPNPIQDFFQIKFENFPTDVLQGEIYDAQGRLVKTFKVNTFNQIVSTADLENGIYVFLIRSEDGIIMREKLLKN